MTRNLFLCFKAIFLRFIQVTKVTVSWALSASEVWVHQQLNTVLESILCGHTWITGAAAALLMCCAHYALGVDTVILLSKVAHCIKNMTRILITWRWTPADTNAISKVRKGTPENRCWS